MAAVLGLPKSPLVNRQNKLDGKSKNLWTLTAELDCKGSPEPQPSTRPIWFRHLCRRTQREATGQGRLDLRAGNPPGSQLVFTGEDGGPVWEQQLKLGGALSPASTQTQLLHTGLYLRVSGMKNFSLCISAARNVL